MAALALVVTTPAVGSPPALVADLATDTSSAPGSAPRDFLSLGDVALFFASRGPDSLVLHRSDGSHDGTFALGLRCDVGYEWEYPGLRWIAVLDGIALIEKSCVEGERELWRSDGTNAGTLRLLALPPGASWLWLTRTERDGRYLFFVRPDAWDAEPVAHLWATDGTAAGTGEVAALDLGGRASVESAADLGGRFVFTIYSHRRGAYELWGSDGTQASTRFLMNVSSATGEPVQELVADGHYYRLQGVGPIWASDGTPEGSHAITLYADRLSGILGLVGSIGSHAVFHGWDEIDGGEIWETDGSARWRRTDFAAMEPFDELSDYGPAFRTAAIGSTLIFPAREDAEGSIGLYANDGAPDSTRRLADYRCQTPGWCDYLLALGGRVLFTGVDEVAGLELWSTDGRIEGTGRLADLCPGGCSGQPHSPSVAGDHVYLAAYDEAGRPTLWRTDGTGDGTLGVATLDLRFEPSRPIWAADVAETSRFVLFPAADERRGAEPWRAPLGVADAAEIVRDLWLDEASFYVRQQTQVGGRIVAWADERIFVSAGSEATTHEVLDLRGGASENVSFLPLAHRAVATIADSPGYRVIGIDPATGSFEAIVPAPARPSQGYVVAGDVERADLVACDDGFFNCGLWSTDGTSEGTVRLAPLPTTIGVGDLLRVGSTRFLVAWLFEGSEPRETLFALHDGENELVRIPLPFTELEILGGVNGRAVLLGGTPEDYRSAILSSDGTVGGTAGLVDFGVASGWSAGRPALLGGRLVLRLDLDGNAWIWATDGTPAGSERLATLSGRVWSPYPRADAALAGGALWAIAERSDGTYELWSTDGTRSGTSRRRELHREGETFSPVALAATASTVFLVGDRYVPEGEQVVVVRALAAIDAATGSSKELAEQSEPPCQGDVLGVMPGRVVLSWDGGGGCELWSSDGTVADTRRIADLQPGAGSSSPADFLAAGSALFFTADDGAHGRELWHWSPDDGALCRPGPKALCLEDGRFTVSVRWHDFAGASGDGHAVPLSGAAGAFWFFTPENVEVIAKALDGRGTNGHHWFFSGALSNVRYTITVRDGETGRARRYENAAGDYVSFGDTRAFGPEPAVPSSGGGSPAPGGPAPPAGGVAPLSAAGSCAPGPERLCLLDGRFAVEADWRAPTGESGRASAASWSEETGAFWFFAPENLELVVKLLDGRGVNDRFWFYSGALSNLEYTITVTDTLSGAVRTYHHPAGTYASFGDVGAF